MDYNNLKRELAKGWNTWNTRSVLSYVLLPEGFALNLCFKEHATGSTWSDHYLKEALIGRFGEHEEKIHPGPHAYDGSYTSLNLKWRGMELVIESGVMDEELFLLVTPVKNQVFPVTLVVESGILWNRKGNISLEDGSIKAVLPGRTISIYSDGKPAEEFNVPTQTPYLAIAVDGPTALSTGKLRSTDEIRQIIHARGDAHNNSCKRYGALSEVYKAMQSCMAWDTIYDPSKDRVITPVSRIWNNNWGGYVLFCWDTYFAAMLAMADNKELAYANAIEITREKTEGGFVPNYAGDGGIKSKDRSQPPVGSMAVWKIYSRYGEKWFLEEIYEDLLVWNRWWVRNRMIRPGFLAWGSNPFKPVFGGLSEIEGVGGILGAALESGMDNSPMYDGIPFNTEKNCMELVDVGLMGLYIMDCEALARIAETLGKKDDTAELEKRAGLFKEGLEKLWDDKCGIFLNKRTDTDEFAYRMSPTSFYALFSDKVTAEQAERMINEHLYNPDEFWGQWILPSISRNDPAFAEQNYWRGRIWAPINFLVYLAMEKHGLNDACHELAEKSKALILKEWLESGHVHENYCALTGEGCNSNISDKFYHWGALLSLIVLMDAGHI